MKNKRDMKKILVVDDDPDMLRVIEITLKNNGYAVTTAIDGELALHKVTLAIPDLIVADLNMPNLSGWRMSQKLKEDERFKNIPIIQLSGLLDKDGVPDETETGDFHMAKPFDPEKLIEKIAELLE